MFLRWLVGAVLSAVALMAWGFLFWALIADALRVTRPLPGESAVIAGKLREQELETGVYFHPFPYYAPEHTPPDEARAQAERARAEAQRGPVFHLFFSQQGHDPDSPMVFMKGWLHFFLASLLAGAILVWLGPQLGGFHRRFGLLAALGLLAGVLVDCSDAIWFYHPWQHSLALLAFHAVEGVVMGLVLGTVVRPAARTAT